MPHMGLGDVCLSPGPLFDTKNSIFQATCGQLAFITPSLRIISLINF